MFIEKVRPEEIRLRLESKNRINHSFYKHVMPLAY
jgi:hypothetical protein